MILFEKYDDNGDGVLVLDEFEALLKSLEPNIKKNRVLQLFRETVEKFEVTTDTEFNVVSDDSLSPQAFC